MPESKRKTVKEVTLKMTGSLNKIVKKKYHKALRVIDPFHAQKLAYEHEMRIANCWNAINEITMQMKLAKYEDKKYEPFVFNNGDNKKTLLARSKYLLFKSGDNWTIKQKVRAKILFT
jgi:transposase